METENLDELRAEFDIKFDTVMKKSDYYNAFQEMLDVLKSDIQYQIHEMRNKRQFLQADTKQEVLTQSMRKLSNTMDNLRDILFLQYLEVRKMCDHDAVRIEKYLVKVLERIEA